MKLKEFVCGSVIWMGFGVLFWDMSFSDSISIDHFVWEMCIVLLICVAVVLVPQEHK